MITKSEVLALARAAVKHFGLGCDVKFVSAGVFKRLALKSPLIAQVLAEGFSFAELKIPALLYHQEKDHIILSFDVLKKIIGKLDHDVQVDFVKSVLYHEIFHVFYEHEVRKKDFVDCLRSEERVCKSFAKKYPVLYKVGYNLHKQATV
ncbi:MAG TPA: hypothetical protein VJB87_04880 [Candidatus Nanoarchaeia archaeon]|nr:hypothetical protein [Candidatus Nanoarchaeia archaeon]